MYNYVDSRSELLGKLKLSAEAEGFDLIFHIVVTELKISRHLKRSPNVCRRTVYYKEGYSSVFPLFYC